MVSKSHARRKQDIKSKLMAAIAMLLVSSIMMVSSTYAWFTLSTAPEVTGITTAVGANGNLEMALLNDVTGEDLSKIATSVGANGVAEKNITWGNLVDVSEGYGLDQIVLNPAKLNEASGRIIPGAPLMTPQYGADGRVSGIIANTLTSILQDGKFSGIEGFGVRAIGVSSGMTDRQVSYRTYKSAAAGSSITAKSNASATLETNGGAIANVAIAKVSGNAVKLEDVQKLLDMTNALLGTAEGVDGVLEHIEKAYVQNIIAYFASAKGSDLGVTDAIYALFEAAVKGVDTVDGLKANLDELVDTGATADKIDELIKTQMNELAATRTNIETAQTKLSALASTNAENYTVAEVQTALSSLVNTDAVLINGLTADQVKEDPFVVVSGGITVSMGDDAGVFADIAQHCGNYSAAIKVHVVMSSINLDKEMDARMVTAAEAPFYLPEMETAVNTAGMPASEGSTEAKLFSEFYGYIIDLAFRTNAAESKLLLQQEGIDRIYDQQGNDQTMGKGSSMTFAASEDAPDFTTDRIKALMENIRIVFFDKNDGTIFAKAKLDMENDVQTTTDGVTAFIRIYERTVTDNYRYDPVSAEVGYSATTTYYVVDATVVTYEKADVTEETFENLKGNLYTAENADSKVEDDAEYDSAETYYQRIETKSYKEAEVDEDTYDSMKDTLYTRFVVSSSESEGFVDDDNDVIVDLGQNQPMAVSVLVYLDGESITNAAVSAVGSTSVTGTMNLQFASSANLVPMDYAALQVPAQDNQTGEDTTD